jgi:GWxTD domain-containing protein
MNRKHSVALKLLLALATVLVVAPTGSTAPVDMGTPASTGGIRFAADVAVTPSADGKGAISVSYAVTHDALHFLRHDGGYRARYDVTAILYQDGRQVTGDTWRKSVVVDTYAETNDRRATEMDDFEFSVPPGRYVLKLELRSVDTSAVGTIERTVSVPRMGEGELLMGTIRFEHGSDSEDESEPSVNLTRTYGEEDPNVRVRIPVYGVPGTRYAVEISVKDQRGMVKKTHADTVLQDDHLRDYVYDFTVLDLDVGSYVLEAEAQTLPSGGTAEARARFRVVTSPLSWGQDEEKMLAQISYVATREEMELLTSVPPEQRGPVWEAFWAKRDPDPTTEVNEFKTEFLRRLAYANAQFRSIVEGWQTDMGRVYIQEGEPDDVDSQPVGQMLNAWEIWYYYSEHTKYVFVDRDGFGEFVLHEVSRI